jgi:hypothetical protein
MTTLNQALRQISALKGKLKETQDRMMCCVTYNETKVPAYVFNQLKEQREKLVADLVKLKTATAMAAARVKLADGIFLCQAVRELSEIKASITFFESLPVLEQAKVEQETVDTVYVKGELTTVPKTTTMLCCLPEVEKAKLVDSLKERFATLNNEVEALNCTTAVD